MTAIDSFNGYVQDISSGKRPACKMLQQAVARHKRDVARSQKKSFAYEFKPELLETVVAFCNLCKHAKGAWAGQPFEPEPWQVFILGSIFCWVEKETGLRRFQTVYIEVPRKNGKSFFAAVIGLILFVIDGEPGAEVYTAATKKDQARLVFNDARNIVRKSPDLKKVIQFYKTSMVIDATACSFQPLASEEDSLDGLNVHCGIIDELHAHKSRGVYDVLDSAMGAREQPILLSITTAGHNHTGICMEIRKYCQQILDPKSGVDDESVFAFISSLDEGVKGKDGKWIKKPDDWRTREAWIKANPNFGVSVYEKDLERMCRKAMATPGAENEFRTKRCNQWVETADAWLSLAQWDACAGEVDGEALAGRACYAGLDLSSTMDITAFVLYFPEEKQVLPFFWCPESAAKRRDTVNRTPYLTWAKTGALTLLDGDVIDYAFIRAKINDLSKQYDIKEVAYDKWNATQLALQLQDDDGMEMVEFPQGFAYLNEPSKELARLIVLGALQHGGQPVLRWMAGNVSVKTDASGNIRPDKQKSADKIDGIVALIMALGRAMVNHEEEFDGEICFV